MGFKPTPEQAEAISIIDRDLMVVAGAGSGKTKVLVERYVNLVEQGFKLNQILAITFTRKAALEMKERIRQTLPDMEQAQISTIHSFCQKVVADHPLQAKIDPHFRMFEEWESKALLKLIAMEVVTQALQQGDEEIQMLREEYRQTKDLVAYLVNIYQLMISKGADCFTVDIQEHDLERLGREVTILQQELAIEIDKWLPWVKTQKLSATKLQVVQQIEELWSTHQAAFNDLELVMKKELIEALASLFGGRWAKELADQAKHLKELCLELKQGITDLLGIHQLRPIGRVLETIHEHYTNRKLAQGLLDYDDLERIAVQLLSIPEVRATYDFKHILLDEAQDTNERQKQLIDLLCADPDVKLFVVGDPKQSIYRFRGAEVEVFLEAGESIINSQGKKIFLKDNFRSRPELVNFTNHVFEKIMADDRIEYEASRPFREACGRPAVDLLVTPRGDRSLGEGRQEEAAQIGALIRELVEQEGYRYSEITILFRAMTNVKIYEEALQLAGIPFVNLSGHGFYDKNEIQDLLNFIHWLQDADDLVSKMAVLRSPFFGLSDQGLFWYQHGQRENLNQLDKDKLVRAYQLYPMLQKALVTLPAPQFLEQLLKTTDFYANTAVLPLGQQRIANIDKFVDTCWQLWSKGYIHMEEQLAYILDAIEHEGREGEARLDNETADVVTLMTIHGSKGLEFPVVILADCSRERTNRFGSLLYHKDEGLAIKDTTRYQKVKELELAEEINEDKRLLYVAVTRARERLVLSGIGTKEELKVERPLHELVSWWEWIWASLPQDKQELYRVRTLAVAEQVEAAPAAQTAASNDLSVPIVINNLPPKYDISSFSVTSLMIYAQCPRRYYYRYILRVPEEQAASNGQRLASELGPLERGNIVHRVCEHLRPEQDLEQLLDWAISMEGLSLQQAERQELWEIVNRYLNSAYYQDAKIKQINHEVEFTVPVEEQFLITGAVDQIVEDKNGITIMDLKTNYITAEQVPEVAASYYWQLRIYAWAINKSFGKPISKTMLYFLFPDVIHTDEDAHLLIPETEEWLRKTCQHIQQCAAHGGEGFPMIDDCTFCGYNCRQLGKAQENFVNLLAGLGKLS